MSAARFKSKGEYFSKNSGLARQVIEKKQARRRQKAVDTAIPLILFKDVFCHTVEIFEIEDKGRFKAGEYSLDEVLAQHLAGEETVKVNPLSGSGETSWNVVRFVLSDRMDHPFTRAKQYADELHAHGIQSMLEVTEGGKGDYHLWIFHEEPIEGHAVADSLTRLGRKLYGIDLEMVPSVSGDAYVCLPLQGESLLFQRRVFVNNVGKMIKNQRSLLEAVKLNPQPMVEAFIDKFSGKQRKAPVIGKTPVSVPVKEAESVEDTTIVQDAASEKISIRASDTVSKIDIKHEKKSFPVPKAEYSNKYNDERFVIVSIADNYYGFPANTVKEILPFAELRSLPQTDNFQSHVIKYGKSYIPLINLVKTLGLTTEKQACDRKKERFLVLKRKEQLLGARVDRIEGIQTIPADYVDSAPQLIKQESPVRGFARVEDIENIVMILDPERLPGL